MKPLFIITSVIHFTNKPLSYSNVRSVFTSEQRIEQTLKTIHSIKKYVPNAQIILIEAGDVDVPLFEKHVDIYKFLGSKFLVRSAVKSKFKGLGEAVILLSLNKLLQKLDYDYLFKISGRYFLNENFSLNYYHEKFYFLRSLDKKSVSTRLYWFPKTFLNLYMRTIFLTIPFLILGKSIEFCLLLLFPNTKIHLVDTLGVSGYIAPTGEFISE